MRNALSNLDNFRARLNRKLKSCKWMIDRYKSSQRPHICVATIALPSRELVKWVHMFSIATSLSIALQCALFATVSHSITKWVFNAFLRRYITIRCCNATDLRDKFPFSFARWASFFRSVLSLCSSSSIFSAYSATSFASIEILYLECSRNAVRKATIGIRYNYSRFKRNATVSIKWRRIALLLW